MKKKVCAGCGMVFVAKDGNGNPTCPVCFGTSQHSGMVQEVEISEEKLKVATCAYCRITADKTHWGLNDLPFYEIRNNTFYCGCRGWS